MSEPLSFTVFEIINEKRREIFVGSTDQPVFDVLARLEKTDDAPIKGWSRGEIHLRSVEFGLSSAHAKAFIETYTRRPLPKGWRFLT